MSDEAYKKEQEYLRYLITHISYVQDAHLHHFAPLLGIISEEVDGAIRESGELVLLHDKSKFGEPEFSAYRIHFYPTDEEKNSDLYNTTYQNKMDFAWEHHYLNNPHHPIYWTLGGVKRDMPLQYIFEMICDWAAMSRYFGNSLVSWYDEKAQKEKDTFTENTRKTVDYYIDRIFRGTGTDW